jgi:hypothetical protein
MKLIARQINGRTIRTKNQRLATGVRLALAGVCLMIACYSAAGLPW